MRFILGTKLGMTQVFRPDGTVVPVTRVQAGPCVVTQVKKKGQSGVNAVQIGYGEQKAFRLNKAMQGHLKGLQSVRYMKEFNVGDEPTLARGDVFSTKIFTAGEKVQVSARSKGKGFQGVVKRHGFKGSPASHGHKDQLRMPGSIGATDAARVFKGTRMGGHMGDDNVTVKNLEIVEINGDELLIKGAVPGARGGIISVVSLEGTIEPEKAEEPAVEEATEAVETPTTEEASTEEAAKEETPAEESVEAPAVEEKKEETPAEEVKEEAAEEKAPAQEEEKKEEAQS